MKNAQAHQPRSCPQAQIWPVRPSTRPPAAAPKAHANHPPARRRAPTADGGEVAHEPPTRSPARPRDRPPTKEAGPCRRRSARALPGGDHRRRQGRGRRWREAGGAGLGRRPCRPWGESDAGVVTSLSKKSLSGFVSVFGYIALLLVFSWSNMHFLSCGLNKQPAMDVLSSK
jgi:hypothetical protein